MYIEPSIDLNKFKEDYFLGLSARDIKEKYQITGRQYRKLCEQYDLTRDYETLKKNRNYAKKPKYIHKNSNNTYTVRKVFGPKYYTYGTYPLNEIAEYIVKELKKVNWDKNKLEIIIRKMKQEEGFMNLINQKIKSLQTTIEFEKKKNNPDYKTINKLEKELKKILKVVE